MISINPDDIMKNYAIFQNILAKTKKDGEVVISKEDVLDRKAFVKQIVDLAMVLSEKHKNCCFAIEGEWGSGKSFVLENIQECLQPEQSEETGADRFFVVRYDCWKYDYYEEPIVAIISVLRDQIDQYINLLTDDAKRVLLETVKNTITKAFQFVLRNIHLGATIVGIYRQDIYEIPPDAIRELIVNAMVHRSYLDHGMIQVAVYDNRLEITSPGKLPMGQTLERMKEGYSKIRNEALAHAFSYMNLIEHWGSGIPRIIEKVKAAGLREPEFIGGEVDLRINIYRGQVDDTVDINDRSTAVKMPLNRRKTADKVPVNEQEQQIYKYVLENVGITTTQAMELLGIKQRRTREILGKMVESGWLKKEGASRSTVYVRNA